MRSLCVVCYQQKFELQLFINCEVPFLCVVEIGIDSFIIEANNVGCCHMTFDCEKRFCHVVFVIIFSLFPAFIC